MDKRRRHRRPPSCASEYARLLALLGAATLTGCAVSPERLMETPTLYVSGEIDPFARLAPEARSSTTPIFYATDRSPEHSRRGVVYASEVASRLQLGTATVRFGKHALTWEQVHAASTSAKREAPVELFLTGVHELASLGRDGAEAPLDPPQRVFADALEARLASTRSRELLVYVHGAKVDFYRACVRTAEVAHFTGRDLVSIAFDWPAHANIFSYVWGHDAERARASSVSLEALLRFLSRHTSARRIHLLSYSAGGIVASLALNRLAADPKGARELRLGTVLFAAADVPIDTFLTELPGIHELADRVTVTVSDADEVLAMAPKWMGGGPRTGSEDSVSPAEIALARDLPKLEIVDVSGESEARGFDIGGHHYWYRHPWVSSDVILNVSAGVAAADRGLLPGDDPGFWHLPPDYPERARAAARRWTLEPAAAPADDP